MKLSAMVGRQLPFLSFLLPSYLVWVIGGRKGLREAWPAALVGGSAFALAQFVVSNFWGPYAADIIAALFSIATLVTYLRLRASGKPARSAPRVDPPAAVASAAAPEIDDEGGGRTLTRGEAFAAWAPWAVLAIVMIGWTYLKLFNKLQIPLAIPGLHNGVFITLYGKAYAAVYFFQPLAAGTAAVAATLMTAMVFRVPPIDLARTGVKTLRQLRMPGLTVALIVALAYLYNYSGMAYTMGAALASLGGSFPFFSGFLG
jgi:lactate permease